MASVFVCHSSVDKGFTRELAGALARHGATVWIDEAELDVGDSLIARISEAVYQSAFIVAVISSSSVRSAWVQKELQLAMTREVEGKRVVVLPLLVDDCRESIPFFLRDKVYADFVKLPYHEALARVLRALDKSAFPHDAAVPQRLLAGTLNVGAVLHDRGEDFLGWRLIARKYRNAGQTFVLGVLSLVLSLLFANFIAGWPPYLVLAFGFGVTFYSLMIILGATYMRSAFEGDRNLLVELEAVGEAWCALTSTWWRQWNIGRHNRDWRKAKILEALAHVTIGVTILVGMVTLVVLAALL